MMDQSAGQDMLTSYDIVVKQCLYEHANMQIFVYQHQTQWTYFELKMKKVKASSKSAALCGKIQPTAADVLFVCQAVLIRSAEDHPDNYLTGKNNRNVDAHTEITVGQTSVGLQGQETN